MGNTDIKFTAVNLNKSSLESTAIENGAVYFVNDTKELFYDFNSQRIEVKDILILETDAERTSILFTPLNKFYFVLETTILWLYKDGTWYQVSDDMSKYYSKEQIDELFTSKIPTKVSDLENDTGFITYIPEEYVTEEELETSLTLKQDVLTAGDNIKIEDNVISCLIQSSGGNDNVTITTNEDNQLQTVAVLTSNNIIKFDWIGTLEEYEAGIADGTITDTTVCFVTDD